MQQPLRALFIEDSETDAELLFLQLEKGGYSVEYERVYTAEGVQQALREKTWDIIFSDHQMPQFNSVAALELRNKSGLDIPFIILSGTIGEDQAVEAMKAGANDYMLKGRTARLIPAVARELNEAKERAELRIVSQELEYFIASLTHDLRTPLWAEERVFELFQTQAIGTLNTEQLDLLKELLKSNRFMQHMVNNILYAHRHKQNQVQLNKKCINLEPFLTSWSESMIVQALVNDKGHPLILKFQQEPAPFVEVDLNELQRVLLNLLKNAADYSVKSGEITISVEVTDHQTVRVGIQDQGKGLDPTIEPYLFLPYCTSIIRNYRQVGTGLGLYLSKQIVEAHEGVIGYISKPGEGVFFYFELPLAQKS